MSHRCEHGEITSDCEQCDSPLGRLLDEAYQERYAKENARIIDVVTRGDRDDMANLLIEIMDAVRGRL